MTFQKRKKEILQLLQRLGEADIRLIAGHLNISEVTVRRDLNLLAAENLLHRTHGGAMRVDPYVDSSTYQNKSDINKTAKDKICRKAAEEIQEGDVIFMDCGSTVFNLCQYIKHKKIKVITNSLPVVIELQNSAATINMIGGEVNQKNQAVHGKMAVAHIKKYHATKAFLGIDGITAEGLYANSELEASNTQAMASQSEKTFLLCDSGKVGKKAYLRFAEVNLVHTLITNQDGEEINQLKEKGVQVIIVN